LKVVFVKKRFEGARHPPTMFFPTVWQLNLEYRMDDPAVELYSATQLFPSIMELMSPTEMLSVQRTAEMASTSPSGAEISLPQL
jgi:hypothetical protein